MKKIYTVRDARSAKWAQECKAIAADEKAAREKAAVQELLQQNPQIGVLCREGKTVYYVYPINGGYRETCDLPLLVGTRGLVSKVKKDGGRG